MRMTTRGRFNRLDSNKIGWISTRRNTHGLHARGKEKDENKNEEEVEEEKQNYSTD